MTRIEAAIAGDPTAAPNKDRPWEGTLSSPVQSFSPIEVACLDIIGKATGRPVADLLGGRYRDAVPFSAYLFYKHAGIGGTDGLADASTAAQERDDYLAREALSPEGIVRQAQEFVRRFGFKSIKLKARRAAAGHRGASRSSRMRAAFGPEMPLRIDPNCVWSVDTSIRIGLELAGTLEYYEDPTDGKANMAEVARHVPMPLATNMCTTSWSDIPETVERGSIHILLSDHHLWGGLMPTVKLAQLCRVFGWGVSMHSNSHLGISLMAMAHVAAAIPNLTYACDTHYPWQVEEVIVGGKRQFDGRRTSSSTTRPASVSNWTKTPSPACTSSTSGRASPSATTWPRCRRSSPAGSRSLLDDRTILDLPVQSSLESVARGSASLVHRGYAGR